MWIIPSNLPASSAFAPEFLDSKEAWSELLDQSELPLTVKGKPLSVKTWLQGWRRVWWRQHLSGRMLKPSHQQTFEERYTESLEDIHVSHSAQPVNGGGAEDSRHLFPHILRHVRAMRPIWCWFENVRGHLSMGYGEVYRGLRDAGYNVECGIYSAEEVGAPHRRDRLFILAILADTDGAEWRESAKRWINELNRPDGRRKKEASGLELRGEELAYTHSDGPGTDSRNPQCQGGEDEGEVQRQERDGLQWERRGRHARDVGTEMGNAVGFGFNEQRDNGKQIEQGDDRSSNAGATGVGQADSCCQGLEIIDGESFKGKAGYSSIERSNYDRWPARPGQGQFDWEAPRTIESGMGCTINGYNFREDLLRALGNSVVEQQAEYAFRDLMRKHFNS